MIARISIATLIVFSAGKFCSAQPSEGPLKIGLLLPPEELQSASIRQGILLAQEQAKQTSHTRIEVVIRGRRGQWGADAEEAARMVSDDGVVGLVAPPDGSASHLVLQVSGRTAVPVVSLCGDSLVSRTGVPWIMRVVPRTGEEAKALFGGISRSESSKLRRWVALVPDGRAGREISNDLKEAASECRCELVGLIEVSTAETNYDLIRAEALKWHPEGILLWLPPAPAGKLAKELRNRGFSGVLAGPGFLEAADFVRAAQDALQGFHIAKICRNEASISLFGAFQNAYRTRWRSDPDAMAAMGYDAGIVLIHLIQSTSQTAPHRFPPEFSLPGVTGQLSFDAQGNRKLKLELAIGHSKAFTRMPPE